MAEVSNTDNKESDNAFDGSDDTIITNTDVDINDLYKLKTEVMALKMSITDQLYLVKQSNLSRTAIVKVAVTLHP